MNTPINIVIVDDNPADLNLCKELLESSIVDYNIYTAEEAESCIQICKTKKVDCLIIDYNLPGIDGIKLIGELQKVSHNKEIPIVMLTGEPHQTVQAEAARRGAYDYMIKDSLNTSEQLDKVIKKVLDWTSNTYV